MSKDVFYHRHGDEIHIEVKDNGVVIDHSCIAVVNESQPYFLAACENAIKQMSDKPVRGQAEWETGLFCGLEDMDITDRYVACRHGYDKALGKVQEWIIDAIQAAIDKANKET